MIFEPAVNCILLIDDDHICNFVTRNIINKHNLCDQIHTVESGEDALQFLIDYSLEHNNKCPEMIFLDTEMPMMNGMQFLGYLKDLNFENLPEIKIIFLTTFPLKNDLTDLKRVFKIFSIEKPLTVENLSKALGQL